MNHHVISIGSLTTRLWLASDKRWKWHTYEAGKRVLRSADDLAVAKRRATDHLRALRDGKAALLGADPATVSEFVAWRARQKESPSLDAARADYVADLERRGTSSLHHEKIDAILVRFVAAHPSRTLASITPEDVSAWVGAQKLAPRTQRNLKAALVGWFRWCRMRGLLPDGATAPERVATARVVPSAVVVYTPAEYAALLASVPQEWRLAVALGGLAGLRSTEIEGLRWEHIHLGRRLIEVTAITSKTRRRRLVPICPALAKWIKVCGPGEARMACPRQRIDNMARHIDGWKKNALRHSYGSYRCAVVKSAAQVALEMGNSAAVVMAHYLEAQTKSAAQKWFATAPKAV